MSHLSKDSRALLDAARDGDDPSSADRRRVRAALARRIGLGAAAGAVAVTATHAAVGGVAASGTSAAAASATGAGAATASAGALGGASVLGTTLATGLGTKLLVSVAIVGALGAGTVSYSRHEEAKRASAATHAAAVVAPRPVAPAPIAPAPTVNRAPAPPVVAETAKDPVFVPLEKTGPKLPRVPAAVAAPDLDAELALLQQAHGALRTNDGPRALALLDEHARRFPNGALAEEESAARVFALREVGRMDEARDVAGRFLREHPRSPLAPRVAHAFEAEPEPF